MGVVERSASVVFAEGRQIQLVEKVEEVDAQIQFGTFTPEEGHGCRLGKTGINRLIARSPEGIAMQERWPNCASVKVRKTNGILAERSRTRASTGRASDNPRELAMVGLEGVGAEVTLGPAEVRGYKSRAQVSG